jgi:hypothetical protein
VRPVPGSIYDTNFIRAVTADADVLPEATDERSSAWRAPSAPLYGYGGVPPSVLERPADRNQRAKGQSLDGPWETDEAVLLAD